MGRHIHLQKLNILALTPVYDKKSRKKYDREFTIFKIVHNNCAYLSSWKVSENYTFSPVVKTHRHTITAPKVIVFLHKTMPIYCV